MILDRILPRKLSTLKNPADWLVDALTGGGSNTSSGVRVTPASALSLAAYFAAIRCISEDVAKVPLIVYEDLEQNGKKKRKDHSLYPILHDQPNANMTAMTLRETMVQHALGWGNGYAEIVRDKSFNVVALELITPDRVTVEINPNTNRVMYTVRNGVGAVTTLQDFQMFHLHGLGYDGLTGYSIAHLAREAIGLGLAQEKSGSTIFGNSARPSGILETDGELEPEAQQNLRESWERLYSGPDNANKTIVLENGVTFKPITIAFKDAQFIEGRSFSASDIARFFRIPPHKIGVMDAATFSNIEQQAIEYVVDTLQSWFVRFEQEIKRKLLNRTVDEHLFAEHLIDGLLRGDIESRYKAYQIARNGGWMSANDILNKENSNPIGEQGDIYTIPLNMQDASKINDEPEVIEVPVAPEPEVQEEEEALTSEATAQFNALRERFHRLMQIESDRTARIVKKDDCGAKLIAFYDEHSKHLSNGIEPIVLAICGDEHESKVMVGIDKIIYEYTEFQVMLLNTGGKVEPQQDSIRLAKQTIEFCTQWRQ